jgi:hypothetical protein
VEHSLETAVDENYEAVTRRKVSQFGMREMLALITCLALTLSLYRGGGALSMLNALPLTLGLAAIAWQVKRVDRWSDVPFEFTIAAVAIITLLLEMLTAWLWGIGQLYAWWPQHVEFIGKTLTTVFPVILCLRTFVLLWSMVDVLAHFVGWIARAPRRWEEHRARFDLLGRVGIALLAVPFWYSFPLRDIAAQRAAESVGAEAIVKAVMAHEDGARKLIHYNETETTSPVLLRLGISKLQEWRGQHRYLLRDDTRVTEYWLQRLPNGQCEVRLGTRTMRGRKLIGVCDVE